jgi:opacity protein-like surface antigen
MMCTRLKLSILIAMVSLAAGTARAADYAPPPQCYDAALVASGRAPYGAVPCYAPPPVIVEEFSSWYLRGDIGFTNQSIRDLTNIQDAANSVRNVGLGFDASPLFGLGIGYYYNDWLRFDVTGEYRSKANFHGTQVITSDGGTITDEYSGSKSEWLFLLNAYVDLGTWNGFTPFVGAGIGTSRNTIHSFRDVCTVCAGGGVAFGDDESKWNLAWALHAGVAYKVSTNFTVEFAYRYVNLGDAASGDLYTYLGGNAINNPMEFKHLTSHDFKVGLRFNFDAFDSRSSSYYTPQPVYQAPVYQPPPVYVQPPLRSKG